MMMEHAEKSPKADFQPITSQILLCGLLVLLSICFGILNFLVPAYYLMAITILGVAALLLFLHPFVGILAYQLITIIQPGVLFPALDALHLERLMAVFLMVALIINIKLRRDKLIIANHRLLYLIGFFILAMVISVPSSYWPGQSVDNVIEFLKNLVYILLIVNIIKTPKRLKIFLWENLLLMGYVAISSAIAYKTGNFVEAQGIIRAQGLAGTDPNTLAISLCLTLPFHFLLLRPERNIFLKTLSIILALCTIYTMILTGSRGGFVGLGMVIILCWWVLPHRGVRLFALLAGIFLMVVLMPRQYQERYASIFSSELDASSQERLQVWGKGLRMFFDHPLTGVGTGAFGTANAEDYSEGRKSYLKAHNLYIQVAAELGIAGIIAFFSYVGFMLYYQRKYRKYIIAIFSHKDWHWGLLMALTIATLTLLAVGMFGHNLYRSNWCFYGALTIVLGVILNPGRPKEKQAEGNVAE